MTKSVTRESEKWDGTCDKSVKSEREKLHEGDEVKIKVKAQRNKRQTGCFWDKLGRVCNIPSEKQPSLLHRRAQEGPIVRQTREYHQ